MVIIDSQVHNWSTGQPSRAPGAIHGHRAEPLGKDELLGKMNEAGIDRVVIVPPSWQGDSNELALDAVRLHPDRFAVMGRLPIENRESEALLPTWRKQEGMLGVRLTFQREHQRTWLTDGTAEWFWGAAECYDIPVMVHAPGSMREIAKVAEHHPRLRLVIDHLGLRGFIGAAALGEALQPVIALARHPNVAVKASALPCFVMESYPFRSLHSHIRRIIEAFGPRRVFWGTDLSRLPCTYRQAVTLFTEELSFLSNTDREWIMGRGITEWLQWDLQCA
jgi:predicted TIM-barrel fold metal-dependent hydrolase